MKLNGYIFALFGIDVEQILIFQLTDIFWSKVYSITSRNFRIIEISIIIKMKNDQEMKGNLSEPEN